MLGFVMKAAGEWFAFNNTGGSYKVKKSGAAHHKWNVFFREKYDQPYAQLNVRTFTSKREACRFAEEHARQPK